MEFSFSEIAGAMPLIPATTFLHVKWGRKGREKRKTQRRKKLFSPFYSRFFDDDSPLSPKFTLTLKNYTQAKAESQHH